MIGLKKGIVKLHRYDTRWRNSYLREKNNLKKILKNNFVEIEHVGSTSIPQLVSKPILDIAVGTKNKSQSLKCRKILKNSNYHYRGELHREEFFFAKGSENRRTVYVKIIIYNSKNWKNYIFFRDSLRKNKKLVKEYAQLKKELSKKYGDNRPEYTKRKGWFIRKVLCQKSK